MMSRRVLALCILILPTVLGLPGKQGPRALPQGPIRMMTRGPFIERFNKERMDQLIGTVGLEVLVSGLLWAEGPVWVPEQDHVGGGYLLFSDVKNNTMYKWSDYTLTVFASPSGYDEPDAERWLEPGSNGLVIDHAAAAEAGTSPSFVYVMEHGNRRVSRMNLGTKERVAVTTRELHGRFNSPNDGTFRPVHAETCAAESTCGATPLSTGELYFTDPPYGFQDADHGVDAVDTHPQKTLPYTGIYRVRPTSGGPAVMAELISSAIARPNGIAFTEDGRRMIVSSPTGWQVMDVATDGTVSSPRQFVTTKEAGGDQRIAGEGAPDGLKIADGVLFAVGPGGVYLFDVDTTELLGVLRMDCRTGNVAFGADDYLYVAFENRVGRVPLAPSASRLDRLPLP